MQLILILAMLGTLLLPLRMSYAEESNTECQTGCITEKATSNTNCPPPGEGPADQARADCLKESHEAFSRCLAGCVQTPPAEIPTDTPTDKAAEIPVDTPTDTHTD